MHQMYTTPYNQDNISTYASYVKNDLFVGTVPIDSLLANKSPHISELQRVDQRAA